MSLLPKTGTEAIGESYSEVENLGLEISFIETGLPDDGLKCADAKLGMIRNWHSNCHIRHSFLHYDMTAPLPLLCKAVLREYFADLFP